MVFFKKCQIVLEASSFDIFTELLLSEFGVTYPWVEKPAKVVAFQFVHNLFTVLMVVFFLSEYFDRYFIGNLMLITLCFNNSLGYQMILSTSLEGVLFYLMASLVLGETYLLCYVFYYSRWIQRDNY